MIEQHGRARSKKAGMERGNAYFRSSAFLPPLGARSTENGETDHRFGYIAVLWVPPSQPHPLPTPVPPTLTPPARSPSTREQFLPSDGAEGRRTRGRGHTEAKGNEEII
jgi:hypothetical protein